MYTRQVLPQPSWGCPWPGEPDEVGGKGEGDGQTALQPYDPSLRGEANEWEGRDSLGVTHAPHTCAGWGVVPLIMLTSEQDKTPISETIRKKLFTFLGNCRGHNNIGGISKLYKKDQEWDTSETKILRPDKLWPGRVEIPRLTNTTLTGKKTPHKVRGGNSHIKKGGYGAQRRAHERLD